MINNLQPNIFGSLLELTLKSFTKDCPSNAHQEFFSNFIKQFSNLRLLGTCCKSYVFDKRKTNLRTLEISIVSFSDDCYIDVTKTILKNLECLKVKGEAGSPKIIPLVNKILNENQSTMIYLELDFKTKTTCSITADLRSLKCIVFSDLFFLENKLGCL